MKVDDAEKLFSALLWCCGSISSPDIKKYTCGPTSICDGILFQTQGKIDLRNESGRPMKVKVVGEVSEK